MLTTRYDNQFFEKFGIIGLAIDYSNLNIAVDKEQSTSLLTAIDNQLLGKTIQIPKISNSNGQLDLAFNKI